MNQNFALDGQEATTESEQPEEELNQQTAEEEQSSTMEELLDDNGLGFDFPRQGDIRKGTVARVSDSEILVSIGTKSEGVIPSREIEQIEPEMREELTVGNEITVYVVNPEDQNGNVLLSFVRALEEKDWLYAESLLASGETLDGKIVGFNKGGLIIPVGQLRGFVPASQVSLLRRIDSSGSTPEQRWGEMVDEPITVSVIEVDRERRRLILSERVALQETRESLKERLLDELAEGDVRTGRVTSLADFGAFVNIDGADGLVHLSEISWERIEHPREVLSVGQEVQVKVIGVDRERKRIGLSIRQLQEDPWVQKVENLKEGQLIEGTITHLTKFGAFARLDEDLEGLIHISEISEQRVTHPKEVLHEGDVVTLRVIKIEPERHRIGLSLRKVDSPAYTDFDWKMTLAEVVEESQDEEDVPAEVEGEALAEGAEEVIEDGEIVEEEAAAEETEAAEEIETAEAEVALEEIETAEESETELFHHQPLVYSKMKKIAAIITLVLVILIGGCNTADQETPTPVPESIDPSPESTSSNIPTESGEILEPTATPTPTPDSLSRYNLSAILDYNAHTVQVEEQVSYVNTTGSELSELLLLVEPNSYPGGFTLNNLAWEDGTAITSFTLNGRDLLISLPEILLPGDSVGIALSYQLNLPNQNAPYGYTERQTNLGDWYPYVPPYIPGEGWLVRDDAFLGEHLAYDMAEFVVDLQLGDPFSASGAELVLAASSAPEMDGEVYRYHHAPARNFAWTVSDLYQVLETQVGDVQVKGYSFPFHSQADGSALDESAKALAIFNELFGPYPHQSFSVVEADFLDGMEYDGLVFLSHAFYDFYTGDPQSNLTIIAAHEVAHQWFYGLVGNDQALEPWLDEALSTFSEIYFYEQVYPEMVDWWWENRINFHNPQGWVDSTIYEPSGFYPYRDAVYLRGAMFLGELRNIMGDGDFLIFLRDYLEEYRAQQVSGDDFFNLLSAHTAEDLSGLIANYFSRR